MWDKTPREVGIGPPIPLDPIELVEQEEETGEKPLPVKRGWGRGGEGEEGGKGGEKERERDKERETLS